MDTYYTCPHFLTAYESCMILSCYLDNTDIFSVSRDTLKKVSELPVVTVIGSFFDNLWLDYLTTMPTWNVEVCRYFVSSLNLY